MSDSVGAPFFYTAQLFRIGLPGSAATPTAPLVLESATPSANVYVHPRYDDNITISYHSDPLAPPARAPTWQAAPYSLPWEPLGYTTATDWMYPPSPLDEAVYTVNRRTGDLWVRGTGAWEYVGPGRWAADGPTPEGARAGCASRLALPARLCTQHRLSLRMCLRTFSPAHMRSALRFPA